MCCFSKPVYYVAGTNIFARPAKGDRQYLVYSMTLKAGSDLSMILPIPTPQASKEDAVAFISLEKYPEFFDEMRLGFPERLPRAAGLGRGKAKSAEDHRLKVVEVGSFVASFVPSVKDFSRLDEQFRLASRRVGQASAILRITASPSSSSRRASTRFIRWRSSSRGQTSRSYSSQPFTFTTARFTTGRSSITRCFARNGIQHRWEK